ncbi:Y-family DNA polymerase [Nakamurella leprariae]|uniref:DNA polymerase Y family protein n=1 Tax=Nakamurella leprariae TaxID=2803911 RepID=A0A939C177_9ACTN|nr:DNA polymerase Y family protein [Nakamurella leprariae]MBM9466887.1 DNA polymerase Y family protein [Nakamurella leprariae]
MTGQRTLVLWCPDWPAVAAARELGRSPAEAIAVMHAHRVRTCTTAARAEGVRVGQRRRDAQSRCPDLLLVPADADRDARAFEVAPTTVEGIAPGVEVLRPGLLAVSARGPARFFGSEIAAAERIVDAVEALDIECRVGIADELPVAVLAAHRSAIVPPGESAPFCAPLPVAELAREPAIAPPERADLVDLLGRLGITTLGAFAALPERTVVTRFGADARQAHRLAQGRADRDLSRRTIPTEILVDQECDPPVERVDAAAFAGRALAERLHARLADAGLACTRLAVVAHTEQGAVLSRVWRCARPLTPADTADRVRWQLDGWLTKGGAGAITRLRLEPIEAVDAGHLQFGLWGSDAQDDQRAGWAFARVQGLLGPESVLATLRSGGRGPAERVATVPWGQERIAPRDPDAPWPGAVPTPTPTRLPPGSPPPVTVLDAGGDPVRLTGRGALTAPPAWVGQTGQPPQYVQAWAGPWVADERWWATPDPAPNGRMQLITATGVAMMVTVGAAGWAVEGIYD